MCTENFPLYLCLTHVCALVECCNRQADKPNANYIESVIIKLYLFKVFTLH